MFLPDLPNESVWDVPCVPSRPFLCKQKPRIELTSPSAPSAITACLLWQKVARIIIRVVLLLHLKGKKLQQRNPGKSLITQASSLLMSI